MHVKSNRLVLDPSQSDSNSILIVPSCFDIHIQLQNVPTRLLR